jgi:hypothetical protein
MIARAIGTVFRALARLRPGEAGHDLDHVGAELIRLDGSNRPPSTTAR